MTDLDREHLLQKIVATSGFLFALLVLPIAQYLLINGEAGGHPEQGQVAGVTTDESLLRGSVPSDPTACRADQEKELRELRVWQDGRLLALQREYETAIEPYQAALPVLSGSSIETERQALQRLINDETRSFEAKRDQIITAVERQAKEISARPCETVPSQE
jgi:hypothetical protein